MSFKGTVPDADTFSRSVGDVYQQFAGVTNLGRTLYWMVGRQTGETTESMIKAGGFDYTSDSIIDAAEGFGIQTKSFDHHSYRWGYWEVVSGGERYCCLEGESVLPSGSNGYEDFNAFVMPNVDIIKAVYDRIRPMLEEIAVVMSSVHPSFVNSRGRMQLVQLMPLDDLAALIPQDQEPLLPPLITGGPALESSTPPPAQPKSRI